MIAFLFLPLPGCEVNLVAPPCHRRSPPDTPPSEPKRRGGALVTRQAGWGFSKRRGSRAQGDREPRTKFVTSDLVGARREHPCLVLSGVPVFPGDERGHGGERTWEFHLLQYRPPTSRAKRRSPQGSMIYRDSGERARDTSGFPGPLVPSNEDRHGWSPVQGDAEHLAPVVRKTVARPKLSEWDLGFL